MPQSNGHNLENEQPLDEAVHDMIAPVFASPLVESIVDSDEAVENIDGTVLYLNDLMFGDDNSVTIKSDVTELVHLVTTDPVVNSGIAEVISSDPSKMVDMHYYEFPHNVTVYADHDLHVIYLDG